MASCTCENWTLEDLASALQDMHKDNKIIAVPMFQRGKRWKKNQQQTFIDSLIKGYPVGTMLFYETIENGKQTYILVDGLQRGNSIKMYMNNPTDFFYDSNISEDFCSSLLKIVNADTEENYTVIRSILTDFIKEKKCFKNLQYYEPAKTVADRFNAGDRPIGDLISVIATFFEERQTLYEQIALTVIPVIVYHGDESNLPEIFDRINSQGTPLDPYEVYAAAWPVNRRFQVNNMNVVEAAIRKYDAFRDDGFIIHGYDRETMRSTRSINAFEYLFGLSKYLVSKYDILGFNRSLKDDTVNPLGFELVNACLNDTDKIKSLYQDIYNLPDVNLFEESLCKAIVFVTEVVSAITRFKGNTHSGIKLFHSKYQILSMISTTFKEMFEGTDYSTFNESWIDHKNVLAKNLRLYYVYDIITNYWSEGGTSKIFKAARPNRYMLDISPSAWKTALDSYFERSMFRTESKQIANPKSEEFVILNCIYLRTFTAADQLSIDRFDVEHIAPKEQMKKLIATCEGAGLPISCIANLCYLPEYVNRSKKDKNFYQDNGYLQNMQIEEIEQKYSFTSQKDLEWMDLPYSGPDDFNDLKQYYIEFCTNRFAKMKRLFCESIGIQYIENGLEISESDIDSIQNDETEERERQEDISVGEPFTKYYLNFKPHNNPRIEAKARCYSDGSFEVLEGSAIIQTDPDMGREERKALIQRDIIQNFKFVRNHKFSNISHASHVIYGNNAGENYWRTTEVDILPQNEGEEITTELIYRFRDGTEVHTNVRFIVGRRELTVLEGTAISKDGCFGREKRSELIASGNIESGILIRDYQFRTASFAAETVLGRRIDALRDWRTVGGQSLRELGYRNPRGGNFNREEFE